MRRVKLIALLITAGLIAASNPAMAAGKENSPVDLPDAAQKGVIKSGMGSEEVSQSQFSNGDMPSTVMPEFSAQSCYSNWWISGSHTYKWKWAYFYSEAEVYAKTWTRYGSSTGPCAISLIVDKIEVTAATKMEWLHYPVPR